MSLFHPKITPILPFPILPMIIVRLSESKCGLS
nr:MAG TPA: hypothetical protein [Caudoviricetes sp.]